MAKLDDFEARLWADNGSDWNAFASSAIRTAVTGLANKAPRLRRSLARLPATLASVVLASALVGAAVLPSVTLHV